jgi:orotate phosphoribosyltransferase-like protein
MLSLEAIIDDIISYERSISQVALRISSTLMQPATVVVIVSGRGKR